MKHPGQTTLTTGTTSEGLIVLGLGSNVGDCEAALRRAVAELTRFLGPLEVAPLYRTAPISPIPQGDFLNTVVLAGTPDRGMPDRDAPGPEVVLARAKELEREAGRQPGPRLGPRVLDVDLLLYGDRLLPGASRSDPSRRDRSLILPHPRMRGRRFVLAPLHDLRPALRLPPDGTAVRDLLAALGTEQPAERIGWS